MKRLSGRHLLITGAGRGIGAACADLAAQEGAHVSLIGRTESQILSKVLQLRELHPHQRFFGMGGDISQEKDVVSFVQGATEAVGPVTDLLNNAAQFHSSDLVDTREADWAQIFDVNVKGVFLCCREVAKKMIEQKTKGSILTVGSLAGVRGLPKFPGTSAYAASKSALIGLTEVLAVELKPHHIRVNLLAPGAIDTEMLRSAFPDFKASAKPEELARTIMFFFDPKASSLVSGSVLEVMTNPT